MFTAASELTVIRAKFPRKRPTPQSGCARSLPSVRLANPCSCPGAPAHVTIIQTSGTWIAPGTQDCCWVGLNWPVQQICHAVCFCEAGIPGTQACSLTRSPKHCVVTTDPAGTVQPFAVFSFAWKVYLQCGKACGFSRGLRVRSTVSPAGRVKQPEQTGHFVIPGPRQAPG